MSIKERPLIKTVERLGPLPGFLFAHPIVAGFFAMVGGVLGIAFLAGFDYFAADPLREYFQGGYLICTSMCSP
jgi:hypothetical protein